MSNNTRPRRTGVRRIAINGRFLDEVQTRLEDDRSGSVSHTSYPAEQHHAIEDEDGVTLRMPAMTALQWLHTLVPLQLHHRGIWDPDEEYWGEEGEPIEEWATPIIARGPRPMYEMEQVLPGADPDDPDSDPILRANNLRDAGRKARARQVLERLLIKDLRCLDAHAHLGNLVFSDNVRSALWHYERGVLIGRLSLVEDLDCVLPWGLIDNRPFLRCIKGLGLCLWRLQRFEEAENLFERILWLSPSDNLGIRFLLPRVRARIEWSDSDP